MASFRPLTGNHHSNLYWENLYDLDDDCFRPHTGSHYSNQNGTLRAAQQLGFPSPHGESLFQSKEKFNKRAKVLVVSVPSRGVIIPIEIGIDNTLFAS